MSITFNVHTDRIDLAEELEEEFRKEARAVVREAVDLYVDEIKDQLRKTGSRPSRPNEPPSMQSGDLERSFRRGSVRLQRGKASIQGDVISTLPYEEVNGVEYGHTKPTGERVLPRPFVRPADEVAGPKVEALFEERL